MMKYLVLEKYTRNRVVQLVFVVDMERRLTKEQNRK